MSKEAMTLALEALKEGDWYIGQLETIVYSSDDDGMHGNRAKVQEAIKALEEALAKQEQKRPQNCGTSYCSCIECVMDEQEQGEPVAGCACRWNHEGDRTVTCERHQGWLDVVVEWADRAREAEAKLKTAPQPKQEQDEPVAYLCENAVGHKYFRWKKPTSTYKPIALYTTPQPSQKPLTDEQRFDLLTAFEPHKNKWEAPAILIDMVEAAHGIKE